MKDITEFLYPVPAPRKAKSIVGWWESRRLHYNAIVGGAGLISFGICHLLASLPPFSHPIPFVFWAPAISWAIGANLFYFMGPTAEILLEKLFKGRLLPTGPMFFRMGLTFAVGLTLFPTLLVCLEWVLRILRFIF